ncbi:MAG: sigma-70 family RNA polymerase sigma factor [Bacteroidales bacterium]|nr:sigma-70 family RNA polymerase sigma factor [Bacteroidales bacterium]
MYPENIIKGIELKNQDIINRIYKTYFGSIHIMIKKNHGTKEESKDVFQEAMIIIYKRIKDKGLNLTCSFKTYIYSICYNLWLNEINKKKN